MLSWSLRARLCPATPRLLLTALAILYIPGARAATLASGYPKVQNGLLNGDGTGAGAAAVIDPLTQQLWTAGSANDPNAAAQTGVVVLEDGKGNAQSVVGLRLGSNGSSCTIGGFNYCTT